MTEREKVLLQREAIRKWYAGGVVAGSAMESEIRAAFPLPPKREPRVERGPQWSYRLHNGVLEYSNPGRDDWATVRDSEAIQRVLASPYIEVPDPEDAE